MGSSITVIDSLFDWPEKVILPLESEYGVKNL